jgi:hypothetical protein
LTPRAIAIEFSFAITIEQAFRDDAAG